MKKYGSKIWDGILAMVPANLLNVFKKSKYEDDEIKFQWGDRYICACEIVDGVGGKYWKYNEDGTITRFTPPDLQFRCIKAIITGFIVDKIEDDNIKKNKHKKITSKEIDKLIKFDKTNYTITFKEVSQAVSSYNRFMLIYDDFWAPRCVIFELNGNVIKCTLSPKTKEWTYTQEHGPNT